MVARAKIGSPRVPVKAGTEPRRTGAVSPIPVLEVSKLDFNSITRVLRRKLMATGYMSSEVLIRTIDRDRLHLALETGTDRNDTSSTFSKGAQRGQYIAIADANPELRRRNGITPSRMTYANRLAWKEWTPRFLYENLPSTSAKPTLDAQALYSQDSAILVYDATKLPRAPRAEVEYWFSPHSAKECLLFAIALPEKSASAALKLIHPPV